MEIKSDNIPLDYILKIACSNGDKRKALALYLEQMKSLMQKDLTSSYWIDAIRICAHKIQVLCDSIGTTVAILNMT